MRSPREAGAVNAWAAAAAVVVVSLGVGHTAPTAQDGTSLRVGLIGLDTSHSVAFTELLNDTTRSDHVPGARVVAAFRGGSPDVEASASRIDRFTTDLRDKWGLELVGTIEELVSRVDAVLLTSVDGRVHLAQARPVLAARKPLFVDKPFTAGMRDALELARLARETGTAVFSTSSLRFTEEVQSGRHDGRLGGILGAVTWGPAPTEPHHPDLFWYGIHAVETLYTFMGPGCLRVTRTHTAGADIVTGEWRDGRIGVMRGIRDGASPYGFVLFGRKGVVSSPGPAANAPPVRRSSYHGLMSAVVEFFRTRTSPVPLEETIEIMAFMEAADVSKARNGAPVALEEVWASRPR